jgi:S1-C subfamily serine protease
VNSKDPNEKIDHCSRVIGQSRGIAALTTAHNTRGLALMAIGRFVEAAQDFTFVIRYEPRVAGFYDNRQNAYRRSGQLDLALLDASMAIHLAPSYSFVYRGRANVYNDMGKFDLAIGDYNKAIELAPQDGGLFIERGKIHRGQANFDQAIFDFSHALELDQKWDAAYRERGLTYQQLEQPAKALADLEVYNKLEPGDPTVILALQAVSSSPVVNVPGPSTPKQEEPKAPTRPVSSGTGFYIATDGSVLTNAHVVKGCSEIAVSAKAGEFSSATVLATDTANDLVLLKTNERPEKVAALRQTPRLGESVEAFGYPLADILATSGNFSLGNISALSGLGDDSRYLQISVPVQPGNSGGPLLDQHGNLVGGVSAKLNALNVMLQKEGDMPQNVNFAIKASVAATFLQSNNVKFASGESVQTMEPPDLADLARALSVFVICR